jgi:hypothetical protein
MATFAEAVWNFATGVFLLGVSYYSYRLHSVSKGGTIQKAYTYILLGFAVMCAAFFVKFVCNLFDFEPVIAYGISVRDTGVLVGTALLLAGLRRLASIWTTKGPE